MMHAKTISITTQNIMILGIITVSLTIKSVILRIMELNVLSIIILAECYLI
jgi:hypothetical protein